MSRLRCETLLGLLLFLQLVIAAGVLDFEIQLSSTGNNVQRRHATSPVMVSSSQKIISDDNYNIGKINIDSKLSSMAIDFTSADTWAYGQGDSSQNIQGAGEFKLTFEFKNQQSTISGTWSKSTIGILGSSLQNVPIARVASSASVINGNLGVGAPNADGVHSNLVQALRDHNVTSTSAYAVTINSDGGLGAMNFGAPDKTQYSGSLATYPGNLIFSVSSITVGSADIPLDVTAAIFDRTKELIYLSEKEAQAVAQLIGSSVELNQAYGFYSVDCHASTDAVLKIKLGDLELQVPMQELVAKVEYDTGKFDSMCALKIIPKAGISQVVLGSSFLRYVYQYNDIPNGKIQLAQSATPLKTYPSNKDVQNSTTSHSSTATLLASTQQTSLNTTATHSTASSVHGTSAAAETSSSSSVRADSVQTNTSSSFHPQRTEAAAYSIQQPYNLNYTSLTSWSATDGSTAQATALSSSSLESHNATLAAHATTISDNSSTALGTSGTHTIAETTPATFTFAKSEYSSIMGIVSSQQNGASNSILGSSVLGLLAAYAINCALL